MDNTEIVLHSLQQVQIEILDCIDEICKKNGINYSLYAGTLLGAVRHKGFIPWDDDLDICMTREDYNRFLSIWDTEPHQGFILQNKENSPNFSQSFTKIRKDHTTFLQFEGEQVKGYHTGIFVDVFPIDRMPSGKIERLFFTCNCLKYQLYSREYIPDNSGIIMKLISIVLLMFTPKKNREKKRANLLKRITRNNKNSELEMVGIETGASIKRPLGSSILEEFVELPFGEKTYFCDANWDQFLKRKYDNYMQLPPEEERVWKHHPILIDFECNYDELSS